MIEALKVRDSTMVHKTRHVGAGVPLSRLPRFDQPVGMPSANVLNVMRVALDRADMNHRATGFHDFEIAAAKDWVRAASAIPQAGTPASAGDGS